jgi:hypothetical protein
VLARGGLRRAVGLQVELDGQAHEAQGAQRVVGQRPVGHEMQPAAADVPGAVVGSISPPPGSGSAIALTVKSRRARSASIVPPRRGVRSTCQRRSGPMTRRRRRRR